MTFRAWHHTSLAVSDLDVAIRFYGDAFGYRLLFREDGMAGQIQSIAGEPGLTCDIAQLAADASPHVLELVRFHGSFSAAHDKPFRPGMAHIAFVALDLDATMARVEALGAVRLGEVTRFEEGRCAYYREPAGSFFELEEGSAAR